MEISTTLIRVVFLLFPGIIASRVYRKLRGRPDRKPWEEFTEILAFALSSYLIVHAVQYGLAQWNNQHQAAADAVRVPSSSIWILDAFQSEGVPLQWTFIAWSCLVAVILSMFASLAHRGSWVLRFCRLLRVTNRACDEDIWTFFLSRPEVQWVIVRDHKLNLAYFANLRAYSDSETQRELMLWDVQVFQNAGSPAELLYEVDVLYVSRCNSDLTIEVPRGVLPRPEPEETRKTKWRKRKTQPRKS